VNDTRPPQPLLFNPIALRSLTARNRIVVSPMAQYASEGGGPTDWHLVHLGKFAMGGAGIVFCEETAVEERARKTYQCAGIYRDEHVPMYRRINAFVKSQGAIPAIQLGHSGRKAACRSPWENFAPLTAEDAARGEAPWPAVSPSPVPPSPDAPVPHELTTSEIRALIEVWRVAALRALDAGYEICEVHGAHGYLLHQFLSPMVNRRNDGYGGSLDGRMRFVLEVIEAVRSVWPKDRPLFFRVSSVDGDTGHWTMDDTVALAREAAVRGVDVVATSSGGIGGPLTMSVVPRTAGYHVPFAERVRAEAGVMTLAVGLITEAAHAESILQRGQADLIGLAREFLYNPNWPVHAARELGVPNYLDLLPHGYAWWLRRREEILRVSREAAATAAVGNTGKS
jgi:2,4-dienoyl-CoA reductase-like NADH-dependent reductase (Old Yellow Enzyme family)